MHVRLAARGAAGTGDSGAGRRPRGVPQLTADARPRARTRPAWRVHLLVYAAILATLAATSRPTLPGDAGEYVAYALAFARGHGPALAPAALDAARADLQHADPGFAQWDIASRGIRDTSGRIQFVHFWLYSAAAAPAVWAARVAGLDPRLGFTLLNAVLLLTGFAMSGRRASWTTAWLIFAGPVVWWLDKPQPEACLVSLVAIALVEWPYRPVLACVAAGIAAAQVPVFAVLLVLIPAAAAVTRAEHHWRRRSAVMALAAGGAIALVPAAYYLAEFHTPTLLATAAAFHVPSAAEFGTVLGDLNLGLFPNWPWFAVVLAASAAALVARADRGALAAALLSVTSAAVVLTAALQIGNLLHGGTPGMMRYAIWLAPLAVPLFAAAARVRSWRRIAVAMTAISVPWSLWVYRPSVAEFAYRPTRAALWIWRHAPALSRPMPEVFVRSLGQSELPSWTPGCDKILLVGRGDGGMWPRPCAPAEIPERCREPGALCYANRRGRSYAFDRISGDVGGLKYTPAIVWLPAGESAVRRTMDDAEWWSLAPVDRRTTRLIASASNVRVEYVLEGRASALVVLTESEPGARIDVRVPAGTRGTIVDADSGRVTGRPVSDDKTGEAWSVALPPNRRVLVFALHFAG